MFFSLIMDDTTDISVKKQCAFTVINYDYEISVPKTQFFNLVEVHGSTANDLYTTLRKSLTSNKILLNNFVGFSSDTTNVMVGEYHSVFLVEGRISTYCLRKVFLSYGSLGNIKSLFKTTKAC